MKGLFCVRFPLFYSQTDFECIYVFNVIYFHFLLSGFTVLLLLKTKKNSINSEMKQRQCSIFHSVCIFSLSLFLSHQCFQFKKLFYFIFSAQFYFLRHSATILLPYIRTVQHFTFHRPLLYHIFHFLFPKVLKFPSTIFPFVRFFFIIFCYLFFTFVENCYNGKIYI